MGRDPVRGLGTERVGKRRNERMESSKRRNSFGPARDGMSIGRK